jgi:PAS domain S-box-containing protein
MKTLNFNSMRAIILEDELIVARSLKALLLEKTSLKEIMIATTEDQFKNMLAVSDFDLAILDVNIQGDFVGVKVGEFIRAHYRMGLIYLTGYTDDHLIEQIGLNKPDAYVIKPFDDRQIIAIVRQVLIKFSSTATLGNIAVWHQQTGFARSKIEFFQDTIDQLFLTSITDQKGKIIFANQAFCRTSGYSAEELLDKNHNIVNSGLHAKDFFANLWKTIQRGEIWQGEMRNRRKDATYYWVYAYIFPLSSEEDSNTRYYISIRYDITARKEAELNLQEVLSEKLSELTNNRIHLSRATKDESMVGFNSILIHELKRPLNSISMQLDFLLKKEVDSIPGVILAKLVKTRASIAHTIKLMSYLNDTFRRKENTKMEKIDLKNQIQSIIDFVSLLFPYGGVIVHFQAQQTINEVLGYNDALFIGLFNLLKNSFEAFSEDQDSKNIFIDLESNADHITILLRDDIEGGIPKEIADQLFSPMNSAKEGGSGIGLNISRHVLTSMNSTIDLLKTGPEGSTFKITIPQQ